MFYLHTVHIFIEVKLLTVLRIVTDIMKFRCKMIDAIAMRDFTNVANTISKMSKQCVVRLTPNLVCFNLTDDNMPMVWTEMDQMHFFSEYTLAGASEEQNEIYLELNSVMLAKSVSSLKSSAKSVKIKLTNKQQPCLTFEIELPSISADSRLCVHDVPVTVIPRRRWAEYKAPNITNYDVSLEMPQLKDVRSVIERVKNMSPILIITADTNGTLVLKIETDNANVAAHFQNLNITRINDQLTEPVSASVDIKRLHSFLAWDVIHPTSVKCNIVHEKRVNLNVNLENYLNIQYYIPAVAM